MDVYTLYAVNIDNGGGAGSDLFLDQISDWAMDTRINNILLGADGMVDPSYVAVMSQSPSAAFTTSALATVLAKCGISGLAIAADADEYGADLYLQKLAEGATRASGSSHIRLRAAKGILVPRSLSAAQGAGVATLGLELIPTWNGSADPLVIATSQALAGTPSVGEAFTVGPVSINGAQVEGIQSITVDFGITLETLGSDGGVWPTFVCIRERRPTFRIETTDAGVINTFGLTGAAQGGTDSVIYLRKMAEGGTRVADVTAEHISFTIDEGHIACGPLRASHPGRIGAELIITPTYDGTDPIIAISTATAIS